MLRSPTQRRPRPALTLLLLLVLGTASGALAQEKEAAEKEGKGTAKAKTKEAKGTGKTAEESDEPKPLTSAAQAPTTGLRAFGKMLPVGEQHKELEIPSFKNGAPSSMVQAKSMTRTDDENMFLERMDIWMYGPPGQAERDMRVQLRTATYHMPSSIVASDERSRISRSDFDLQGDTLIFDTVTGQGKMVGNVKMILHDASSFTSLPGEVSAEKAKDKANPESVKDTPKSDATAAPASPTAGGQPAGASTTPAGKPDAGTALPTNRKK